MHFKVSGKGHSGQGKLTIRRDRTSGGEGYEEAGFLILHGHSPFSTWILPAALSD